MNFKKLLPQIIPSLIAMAIWELFKFLLNKIIGNNMDHVGITNFWFILFFISVNLLFFLLHLRMERLKLSKSQKHKDDVEYKQESNYMSGKELMAYWNIEGFELFNCLKKGLQPYTQHGQKIIDTNTLEHSREHSVEYYENLIRGTQETGAVFGAGANVARRLTNQEIKQQARKTFEGQRQKPVNPPPHHMSFTLPNDNKNAGIAIIKMMGLKFRKDEASKFAEKYKYRRITIHLS